MGIFWGRAFWWGGFIGSRIRAMKVVLLALLATATGFAQFETIEIVFEGMGCASCVESLPGRIQRLRGVESAAVDAERGILKVQLAAQNRVRLEQVRDLVEQDGSKAKQAAVRVRGELSQLEGKSVLRPAGLASAYEIEGAAPAVRAGTYVVTGTVENLQPGSGHVVIRVDEVRPRARTGNRCNRAIWRGMGKADTCRSRTAAAAASRCCRWGRAGGSAGPRTWRKPTWPTASRRRKES
jgi:copper chaperone CopZ